MGSLFCAKSKKTFTEPVYHFKSLNTNSSNTNLDDQFSPKETVQLNFSICSNNIDNSNYNSILSLNKASSYNLELLFLDKNKNNINNKFNSMSIPKSESNNDNNEFINIYSNKNNLNINESITEIFPESAIIDYFFEKHQYLKIKLNSEEFDLELAKIMGSRHQTLVLNLKGNKNSLIIKGNSLKNKLNSSNDKKTLKINYRLRLNYLQKESVYFKLSYANTLLYTSESKYLRNKHCEFKEVNIPYIIFTEDLNSNLNYALYNENNELYER